jgi:hypothetical protein
MLNSRLKTFKEMEQANEKRTGERNLYSEGSLYGRINEIENALETLKWIME